MTSGNRKHLKRINAPRHWMLHKMGGNFAPCPTTTGSCFKRSIPMLLLIRNKLNYATNLREATHIMAGKNVLVNGKIRTQVMYPVSLMDVVEMPKAKVNFRIILDVKGRFRPLPITRAESSTKLCKIKKIFIGKNKAPNGVTNDGRTLRYLHPGIKTNDTIRFDFKENKIVEHLPLTPGCLMLVIQGKSAGRMGILQSITKVFGAKDTMHLKDRFGREIVTPLDNGMAIGPGMHGKDDNPFNPSEKWHRELGLKLDIHDDRIKKLKAKQSRS